MGLKNLVVNRPAFYLSEPNYFKYILALSKFLAIFGLTHRLHYERIISSFNSDTSLWKISLNGESVMIQSQYRISRFMYGLNHAGKRQWSRYAIAELLQGEVPDTLIDVGANVGEVSYYGKSLGIKRVLAIEPDPIVLECLEFNVLGTDVEVCQLALGESDSSAQFFLQSHSADSSLFRPSDDHTEVTVTSMRLDTFYLDYEVKGNVLFKMDAEGFEPEVLASGPGSLKKIKWIAIDAGAERGSQTTVHEVVRILKEAEFSEINISSSNIVTARR